MEDHSLGLYTLNFKTGTSGPRLKNWSEVTTIRGLGLGHRKHGEQGLVSVYPCHGDLDYFLGKDSPNTACLGRTIPCLVA